MKNPIESYLLASQKAFEVVRKDKSILASTARAIALIVSCFAHGGKLLIAGNGGSAADAEHFAAEFVGRFMKERAARPALALTSPSATITAWSNDASFEDVFARQLEAFGKSGDVFFGISTSGNSKNIIRAVKKAQALRIKSICLLGNKGGALKDLSDIAIAIQDSHNAHIQEVQIALIHIICQEVEKTFTE